MQIKLLFRLVLAVCPLAAAAQSTYIRTGSLEYHLTDRLEIKTRIVPLNQSFVKPLDRKTVFAAIDSLWKDSLQLARLTDIDRFNINKLTNDPEWDAASLGKQTAGILVHSANKKSFLRVDPVLRAIYSSETNNTIHPFNGTIGFDARAGLFKKLAVNVYATAQTERLPAYISNWQSRYHSVPGIGDFNSHSNGKVSYADIRGSVQTPVTKFIDLQLGYDRMFLGNGYRSLFLSDISNNMAFFKINARIWKLNFQSLYMKISPQDGIVNQLNTKKFLRLNTLSIDATRWLNISFFDAVVLGRENGFDLNYLLPVTFLRAMEHQSGSPDNALFGMNIKANAGGKWQFYAQGLLDEFKLDELSAGNGWWANKFGYQLGAKYIDAFGIENLDLQFETNRIRPFTYAHFDSVSNYTHANQPMAHPLGAGFHEFIGLLHYQPLKKLYIDARMIYYKQGLDSLGKNMGNNVLINYNTRPRDYGWTVGSGNKATCLFITSSIAYEVFDHFFAEASVMRRQFKTEMNDDLSTTLFSLGLRWNIGRREFDF